MPLLQSPEAAPLAGFGTESQIDRRSTMPLGALQGVNPKTVRWTVSGEGTLCKRERPLKLPVYFFRGDLIISVSQKRYTSKDILNINREKSPFSKGKISLYLFICGQSVSKGTPSLAWRTTCRPLCRFATFPHPVGNHLFSNSPLDCWKIHPLRSA